MHPDRSGPRRMAAMTLFEVLIALAMFSFAVIGCLIAYNSTLAAARETRFDAEVRGILEDRASFLEGAVLREYDGEIESGLPGLKIRESITREQMLDPQRTILEGFWKIEILAEWERDGFPQSMGAGFLRYEGQ